MEQSFKLIMDNMKTITHKEFLTILKELDHDLVLTALGTERFRELFFDNCKDDTIRLAVEALLD